MAHAQKPYFIFRRNGRVHLNQRGRQFSRLLAAEVCASAVVMLDTPCSEVVWRLLATHSIRQFPLHFPSRASLCAITFQKDSTRGRYLLGCVGVGLITLPPSDADCLEILSRPVNGLLDFTSLFNGAVNKRTTQRRILRRRQMTNCKGCGREKMLISTSVPAFECLGRAKEKKSRQNCALTGIQTGTSRFKARKATSANFSPVFYRQHGSCSGKYCGNTITGGWEGIRSWSISRYYYSFRLEKEDARKYSDSIIDNVSEQRNF